VHARIDASARAGRSASAALISGDPAAFDTAIQHHRESQRLHALDPTPQSRAQVARHAREIHQLEQHKVKATLRRAGLPSGGPEDQGAPTMAVPGGRVGGSRSALDVMNAVLGRSDPPHPHIERSKAIVHAVPAAPTPHDQAMARAQHAPTPSTPATAHAPLPVQRGTKGGTFVVSKSGKKRYVSKK